VAGSVATAAASGVLPPTSLPIFDAWFKVEKTAHTPSPPKRAFRGFPQKGFQAGGAGAKRSAVGGIYILFEAPVDVGHLRALEGPTCFIVDWSERGERSVSTTLHILLLIGPALHTYSCHLLECHLDPFPRPLQDFKTAPGLGQ
jgi:hypothetical protein